MTFKMRGVIPPMITPFNEKDAVCEDSLRKLVHFLDGKVDGVFICGSYGSGPMLSIKERKKVLEIVIQERKNLQVISMTGAINTKDTIELTQHAKDAGADAASAVSPFYFHHHMDDVIGYYKDVVDSVGEDFPFYIYTNPKFSGYDVDLKTLRKIKDAGVHGVKSASFDMLEFANVAREFQYDEFDVVLGTEALFMPASLYGCKAFIPGLANAFPELCKKMYTEAMNKEYDKCCETQLLINEVRDIMYYAKSTQLAIYAMLEIRGVITSHPRKPFVKASSQEVDAIKEQLVKLGVI